jgi:ribosomal protein L13E
MVKIRPKIVRKGGKQREGKGFSRDELRKAGTSFAQALKMGIPIDRMRRTAHDENVETVKAFLASAKTSSKTKRKKTKRKPKSQDLKGKSAP